MSIERYAIGIAANNIDFYVGYKTIVLFVSASSSVSASVSAIQKGAMSSSGQLTTSFSAIKISKASSAPSGSSSVSIAAAEILHVLLYSDSHLTTSFDSEKIAYGSASSDFALTNNIAGIRIKPAISAISASASVSASLKKIAKAAASSTPVSSSNFNAKEINLAQCLIMAQTSIIISPPIVIRQNYIDSSSIRTFLRIDSKPITDHNRKINITINPSFIENKNWNNKKNRYYRRSSDSGRKNFDISWGWLPGQREHTVDQRYSRDYLKQIANDPSHHTLEIIEEVENGTTAPVVSTYTVFVRSYSERVVKRDVSNDVYYFECSLTLEEA